MSVDLKVGDEILTGRFRNKKEIVKSIDTDDLNQPTVNGKQMLKFRIKKLIKETLDEIFTENIQLADKVYFNTNKLSPEAKNEILKITNGDNFTKIVSDLFFSLQNENPYFGKTELENILQFYQNIKTYNKNVYPIKNVNFLNPDDIWGMYYALQIRSKIINLFKILPSTASRNMKDDIRTERSSNELSKYLNDIEYFTTHFSQLSNRNKEMQEKVYRKMFKSNTTIEDLMQFVDDKENFLGGASFGKQEIIELSKTEDFEIIYQQGNSMIIQVDSPEGIKAIGCNSLWCFTYGSGFDAAYRQWNTYSHNDIVYVLVDFDENSDSQEFMHVLIGPLLDDDDDLIKYSEENEDQVPLYDMANEQSYNPYHILKTLFGENYETVIYEYLDFE